MLNNILQRQIENNNIFHSYIIEGNRQDAEEQYIEFSKKALTDNVDINNLIQVISPENNNITIDQIRKITKAIYKKPVKYDYNIFVIEDAHFMRAEAQNALLKTLEEMPNYSIVFMTTNNRFKLLDTIISRSQVICINSGDGIDFEAQNTKNIFSLINKVLEGNYYIINKERNLIKELSEYKHETLFVLTKIFSDALLKNSSDNIKYQSILEKISKFSTTSIEEIIIKIENIKEMLKVNLNFQIAMEDLIFTIIEKMSKSNGYKTR
ncbi:hypothetical protein ACWOAQ_07215 [Helcococcus kunzii]|uniref:DNA polymerase III, delta' subunit n=1 Tax=Helcococcus kunzii ATCC 51366 TaxID=883114 RepID=H3NL55_9FIRM|nr:hypothetical protein [Helcococcus kunzii]EHR36311.1 hypothetical protein HMPREF9709_00066 [Helcococcus kunzii ATCC 51366]MCT1796554.1 hypothetical protein [Helcococcus kunzii]MCT1989621.1 hypothetical protein [Helcococcus kunzii]QUY64001.1 hypothetical protein GUI37_00130 [Helcococcus kunzii]QZO76469.1 hypothetical protein HIF96_00130 [Helcococcus kunzii]